MNQMHNAKNIADRSAAQTNQMMNDARARNQPAAVPAPLLPNRIDCSQPQFSGRGYDYHCKRSPAQSSAPVQERPAAPAFEMLVETVVTPKAPAAKGSSIDRAIIQKLTETCHENGKGKDLSGCMKTIKSCGENLTMNMQLNNNGTYTPTDKANAEFNTCAAPKLKTRAAAR